MKPERFKMGPCWEEHPSLVNAVLAPAFPSSKIKNNFFMRTRGEQDANLRPISITLRERSSASVRLARSHRGNEVDSALRVPHSAFWPPPPHFKRAKADFGGLSAFFHRHFLQFACFQPFAPKKPRCRRHLIPMVRKTCPPWRHRDGGSKLYQPPSTQYAIRAIFRF